MRAGSRAAHGCIGVWRATVAVGAAAAEAGELPDEAAAMGSA